MLSHQNLDAYFHCSVSLISVSLLNRWINIEGEGNFIEFAFVNSFVRLSDEFFTLTSQSNSKTGENCKLFVNCIFDHIII